MEFGIVEVEVEEETEDWVRGPLLVTGLANDATPFLRYRIGDVGTRAKRPCPCGRPGDVFLDVDGRIEDYVMTPDGRLVGRLDHIFKEQLDVAEAQIVQETPGRRRGAASCARPSWSDASERSLLKEIRSRLGDEIRVELALRGRDPARAERQVPRREVGRRDAVRDDPRRPRAHAAELRGPRAAVRPGQALPRARGAARPDAGRGAPNHVYAAVRAALRGLGLDAARFGTPRVESARRARAARRGASC